MTTFGKSRVESRTNIQQLLESTRELTQEYKRSLNKKGSISTSPAGNLKSKTKDSHSASKLTSLPTNTTTTTTSSKQPTTTRSTSRPRASPVHTAINAASNRPEVDISHLTANQSFALPAGLSMTTAPRIPRFFAWEGSTNVPVSDIKSPQSTLMDESMSVQQTSFQWPSKQNLFPAQPTGKGASSVRLGVLTEATSPGAWRSEHDERFSLPNQHSRFATVTASVAPLVTGSQAGGLMDRINHVNRLLAEVEHIYPETATAAVATTTTTASSGVHDLGATNRSGRVVTAHEVAEVAEGVPVEDNVTENNDEKELLNLSQFVTDEITSVIDNALTTIDSSYTGHVTAGNIEIFPDKDAKFPTMSETFPPDNTATTTHQNLNTTFVSESHSNYRWPVTDAYPAMTHSDQVKSKFRPGRKLTKPDYLLNRPDPILGILPQEKEKTHDISLLASEAHSQFVWPSRSVDRNGVTGKYEFINSPAAVCTQAETDGWEIVQKEDAMPTSNHYSTFNEHNQSIHPQVNDSFSTLHDVSPTKSKPNRYSYNSNVGTTKAPLHPISYAFGSTTPTRKSAVHETSVAPIYAPSAPVTKPVLKASTPIQKHSSGRSPVSVSKRFDPILMNQRYPSVGDNKSKWVSETSRSYSLKAVAPRKRF